jgi:hypothetical protein
MPLCWDYCCLGRGVGALLWYSWIEFVPGGFVDVRFYEKEVAVALS